MLTEDSVETQTTASTVARRVGPTESSASGLVGLCESYT